MNFNIATFGSTVLELTNFPAFTSSDDKRFSIDHTTYSWTGSGYEWIAHEPKVYWDYNFGGLINYVKFAYVTDVKQGIFHITNLYGNPSPSYTYTVTTGG